jgi:hypothetical protein
MSQGSRRTKRNAPGFDTLEGRQLLSQFSGAAPPGWGRPEGHGGSPAAPPAMFFNQWPGPLGKTPNSWTPNPWNDGQAPGSGGSPSPGFVSPAEVSQDPPPSNASSAQPASVAGSAQPAETQVAPSAALSSPPARPVATVLGSPSARPAKPASSVDGATIVASGGASGATLPTSPGGFDDQVAGVVPSASAGAALSVSLSQGLASSTVALALPWVIPSSSLRPALPSAPGLVTASLEGESLAGATAIAAANLPAPRGAGLITELAAFRNGRIEERLTWLFGGSGKASEQKARGSLYVIHLAIAVLALELARRWQRRVRKGPALTRRFRQFGIDSLH